MHYAFIAAIITAAFICTPSMAQSPNDHASHHTGAANSAPAAAPLSEGVVRTIDRKQAEITLKHGPIANLGMPPMTMSFKAENAAMLERVNAGDKVRFAARQANGELIVTRIERVQ